MADMAEKMKYFQLWLNSLQCKDSNGNRSMDGKKRKNLRRYWCETVARKENDEMGILANLQRLLNTDKYKEILQEMQSGGSGEEWEERTKTNLEEMFSTGKLANLLATLDYSHVEVDCLMEEVLGGMWDKQLGLARGKREKFEGESELAKNVSMWQQLVNYRTAMKGNRKSENWIVLWRDELIETFKAAANAPEHMVSAYDILTCANKERVKPSDV